MNKNTVIKSMITSARSHLLDTSFNNRMINSKITLNKGLSFSVEDLDSFYQLVIKNHAFSFLSMEGKKKEKELLKHTTNNKFLERVGAIFTINKLSTTNKPSLLTIKFTIDDGDSKLLYDVKDESNYFNLVNDLYSDVKKNFTKYGILQNNIYNKNIIFKGFKRHIEQDAESNKLAIYLAIVSILRGEGIPKEYAFLGGLNKKQEVTAVTDVEEKLIFAYEKGIKKIFVPKKNKKEIKNISEEIIENLEIVYISNIDDAILAVFDMLNTIQTSSLDNEFILSKSKQPQKVFYVNYNQEDLKTRIDKIYINSKRHIEEQGINVLFLSIAFAQWKNPLNDDEEINSPLVFIPVNIETSSYKNVYKFTYSNSEVLLNKSLIKKLELDLSLDFSSLLLEVNEETEFNVVDYLNQFNDITKQSGFDFNIDHHSVHLSFYSYNKFLMYNDLDFVNWEEGLIQSKKNVLSDVFENRIYHEISNIDDDKNIDNTAEIDDIKNVVDADSSQLLAVSKVNRGNSIIIQGPPGTGKSQTIVNIISEGIRNNKKILFMSEKLAAMEVVYNRLKAINLSHVALQLHSDKINKSQVVKELQSIYYMNKINVKNKDNTIQEKLVTLRSEINNYYELLRKKAIHSNVNIIDTYRKIIELENHFENNQISHFNIEIPNSYLMSLEDISFDKLIHDIESLENFYNKYESVNNNALKFVGLNHKITHHNLIRFNSHIENVQKHLKDLIKNTTHPKIASTKQGRFSIKEINHLLDIKKVKQVVLDYIPHINHKLMVKNKDLLDEIMKHYELSKTKNQLIKSSVYDSLKYLDEKERLKLAIITDMAYLKTNDSFLKHRTKEYKNRIESITLNYFEIPPKNEQDLYKNLEWLYSKIVFKYLIQKEELRLVKIFGKKYNKDKEDFENIQTVYNCVGDVFLSIGELFNNKEEQQELYLDYFKKFITKDFSVLQSLISQIKELETNLQLDVNLMYTNGDLLQTPLKQLLDEFTTINENLESLNDIIVLRSLKESIAHQLSDEYLLNLIEQEHYNLHISKVFLYIRYHSVVREILDSNSELQNFNALIFDKKIREFIELDNKNIQMNNLQTILDAHFYNVYDIRKDETLTVENKDERISYLLQTFNKRHNIPSVKRLLQEAFEPITRLKPVFMMSPISISQFLEQIVGLFDIVVFDESSQIKPQDAFGALLRGKQVVVVGDEKQLPPTNFFESFYGSTEAFSEDQISNYESILTLLRGNGVPLTTLNWHYRSKHHNLIQVNNEHFYDESLSIFPSKYKNNPEYGLKYEFVDGEFDRGKTRTNIIEARRIAKEVIEYAKSSPNDSLGVATLNITQRDLILSEVKKLRKLEPSLDHFFREDKYEPFFVKNLENVQGDEREVIFISIGYAKDKNQNIIQNYGAINHVGGERRLNVLFSRARRKCVIYSGLRASDLEVDVNSSEGVKVLRKFFDFAEKNTIEEQQYVKSDTVVFAVEIAEELHKHGYEVKYNVGNNKYFVDLAVVNPNNDTEFLLGIEFDNSTYDQSRTAAERERIRNAVMRAKGWAIYKIYITSWFNNRNQEIKSIIDYLNLLDKEQVEVTNEPIEFYEEPVNVVTRFGFEPYKVYNKKIENIHFFMKEQEDFKNYVSELIYEEMPIRIGQILKTLVDNSHLDIKPKAIKNRLNKVLKQLEHDHVIYSNNQFYYYYKKESSIFFRDRRNIVGTFTLQDINDDEFLFAVIEISRNSFGINTEEITSIICNYLSMDDKFTEVLELVERLSIRLINNNVLISDANNNLQIK